MAVPRSLRTVASFRRIFIMPFNSSRRRFKSCSCIESSSCLSSPLIAYNISRKSFLLNRPACILADDLESCDTKAICVYNSRPTGMRCPSFTILGRGQIVLFQYFENSATLSNKSNLPFVLTAKLFLYLKIDIFLLLILRSAI